MLTYCIGTHHIPINIQPGMREDQDTHGRVLVTKMGRARSKMSMSGSSIRPRPSNTNIANTTELKADSSRTLCLSSMLSTCCSNTPTSTYNNHHLILTKGINNNPHITLVASQCVPGVGNQLSHQLSMKSD